MQQGHDTGKPYLHGIKILQVSEPFIWHRDLAQTANLNKLNSNVWCQPTVLLNLESFHILIPVFTFYTWKWTSFFVLGSRTIKSLHLHSYMNCQHRFWFGGPLDWACGKNIPIQQILDCNMFFLYSLEE